MQDAKSVTPPNILFIFVDDLNHWVGHLNRNPQTRTPNIDRLAKRGISFINAQCSAPGCTPSRTSLLSGTKPSSNGCYQVGQGQHKYFTYEKTLPAYLQKSGYRTMGMGKIFHGDGSKAPPMGWDEYPTVKLPYGGGVKKFEGYFTPLKTELKDEDLNDWHITNYCIEQLNKKHDKPFFLTCGMIRPHLPWAVPRKYYEPFPIEDIQLPPHREDDHDDIPNVVSELMGHNWGDHEKMLEKGRWKAAVRSYLATIAYMDMNVGRLLDALDESEYKDNTIVVLTSDHGWHLGEKQHWRKFSLWEEATRVPLIYVIPGGKHAGTLCDTPVDLLSVYPTFCDLANLPKPEYLEGVSIKPLLDNPAADWLHMAITTHGYKNHSVRSRRWRYTRYFDGSEELYDHDNDPYEFTNLANEPEYQSVKEKHAKQFPTINVESDWLKKRDAQRKKKSAENKKKFIAENPMPIQLADPYIMKASDGIYYMVGTGGVLTGFKAYSSTDLMDWKDEGAIYQPDTSTSWCVKNFWAPEMYKYKGKFYLLFSADWRNNPNNDAETFRIGVAVADYPKGPFKNLHNRPLFDPGYPIIDANLLFEGDKIFLYYSRCCYKHPVESDFSQWAKEKGMYDSIEESWIYGVEMKPDFSGIIGEPVALLRPPLSMNDKQAEWESRSVTAGEANRRWSEGSAIFKKNDVYYMMYSANFFGGKNYAVGYATSKFPLGPFVKADNNPVLQKNIEQGGVVTGTGHNSVAVAPDGTMLCVYHGRTTKTGENRVLFIDPMEVQADGTLVVHGPTASRLK